MTGFITFDRIILMHIEKKMTFALLFLLLAFIILESSLNFIFYSKEYLVGGQLLEKDEYLNLRDKSHLLYSPDRYTIYTYRPDIKMRIKYLGVTRRFSYTLATNDRGLRGVDIGDKKPGTIRIICHGNSHTAGFGLAEKDMYSACLEKLLAADSPGRKWEVISAGVEGHSSFSAMQMFKHYTSKDKPDIALFCFSAADYGFAPISDRDTQLFLDKFSISLKRQFTRSAAYVALRNLVGSAKEKIYDKPPDDVGSFKKSVSNYRNNSSSTLRVSLSEFRENIQEIIDTSRKHQIRLAFINKYCSDKKTDKLNNDRYESRKPYIQMVNEIGAANGIEVVNIDFKDEKLWLDGFRDDHPNEKGGMYIAELLLPAVKNIIK